MYRNAVVAASVELGLSRFDIAEIVGATPRLVEGWLAGTHEPGLHFEERVDELGAVADIVAEKMTPRAAHAWLTIPCPELDYYAPIDVLRRGELYTVLKVVEAMPTAFRMGMRALLDDIDDESQTSAAGTG